MWRRMDGLDTYKLLALQDAGFKVATGLSIILFSKSGCMNPSASSPERERINLTDILPDTTLSARCGVQRVSTSLRVLASIRHAW